VKALLELLENFAVRVKFGVVFDWVNIVERK
jgi:hypothetical protein